MNSEILFEFPYGAKPMQTLALFIVALAGECLFVYMAMCPFENLEAPDKHTLDYFFIFAACIGWIGLMPIGILFVSTFTFKMRVAITADSFICPKPSYIGISRDEVEIPFGRIRDVKIESFRKMKMIRIYYDDTRIAVPSNMLPNSSAFEKFHTKLSEAFFSYLLTKSADDLTDFKAQ